MDFEKIEQAYTYLLENVQIIQNDLTTNFYLPRRSDRTRTG